MIFIKRSSFCIALILCSLYAQGQSGVNITVGKPYPVVDADVKMYFRQGDEILTVKCEKKEIVLQKFNARTLTNLKAKVYDDFPKGFSIEKISKFKNSYYVFYSWYDGTNEQLFAREIDFSTGQFKAAKKIVTESEKLAGELTKTGMFTAAITDKFSFYFSYDSTKLLVNYTLKPKVKDDSKSYELVGAHVFDDQLQKQWSNKLKMPYTEKKMNNLDYTVDSKGNVYIVTQVYKDNSTDERKRGEDEPNYFIEILKFDPSNKLASTKVNIAEKFIHTLWMYEAATKDYMVCAGYYNSGDEERSADGIVMFRLGADNKYTNLVTHPIPLSILNQNASKKEVRRNARKEDDDEAEFESLKIREIRTQPDGSLILISEQFYIKEHYSTNSRGGGRIYFTYHYEDLLVSKIEADGKLAWMKRMAKTQEGLNGQGAMSFQYFNGKDAHNFLFMDNEKNIDLKANENPERYRDGKGGYITNYRIDDKTGEVTKTYLVDIRDVKGIELFQFWPGRIMPDGSDAFIFEAYKKGKEDILIKMDLDYSAVRSSSK